MRDLLARDADVLSGLFGDLIHRVLVVEAIEALGDEEVTPSQIEALRYLSRHDPNVVGDLASGLAISYPAATKTVDRLVAKALVSRREGERDRRQSELALTPKGRALLEAYEKVRRERLEAILSRMSPEDHRSLVKGLRGFITAGFMVDKDLIMATCQRCGCDCFVDCVANQAHIAFMGSPIPHA